ncbi:hypothetical protein [Desulfosarcina sp.]|uniref:hypothetical protein n=1 Tax=Desulfosarcina sp. TaxID=2027861 RepID=UPI0029B0573F|nr:hypothetical protein [Desulfosarcina sp.]MDX2454607.1 hypothetical protein [Desulfosarcina sp.]
MKKRILLYMALISLFAMSAAYAQDVPTKSDADLAQELTNPVADLITVPVQMSIDPKVGLSGDGRKTQTNIQPVIPFDLSENWNLITRTIIPIINQKEIFAGSGSQTGLGDISMSLFLAPKASGRWIWGAGPIVLMPSATNDLLGGKKWGAGPSAILLTMRGPLTMGGLTNHVWSFAGDSERSDISNTFVQPFISYTTDSAWTTSLQSETTYNWEAEQWAVPVNLAVAKLVYLGKLPVSLQAGAGYWLTAADSAAEGWRFRLQANFVFPKSMFSSAKD